ncbi:cilia- and flagella-associated protein 161 [Erpetoichthys calabaricus]|nr:cilia- and flagella-associated protein 161 [Erpetoichthys calabaricus]
MSFGSYNPNVRIGNWNEDLCLEEDAIKDFLGKKEKGELITQKAGFLKENIYKPIDLSVTADGFIHFGDVVMLLNLGREKESVNSSDPPREPATLSINVDETKIGKLASVQAPCEVTASPSLFPSVRNAFVIVSVDSSRPGDPLTFGQSFAIRTTEGFAGGLYLTSDNQSFQKCAKKSRLQEVSLVDQPSYLTCWKVIFYDPQMRLEYEGCPIPANLRTLVVHCKTNQCLAALGQHTMWTPYGQEYEVTAHTFLDAHKAERDPNHWLFITRDPGNGSPTMIERSNPIPERMSDKE